MNNSNTNDPGRFRLLASHIAGNAVDVAEAPAGEAAHTDGKYFAASDEKALAAVYDSIDLTWTVATEHIELTAVFAAVAALLLLAGVGLSFLWFGRAV